MQWIILAFIILYLFAEGLIEGYTWAGSYQRKTNLLISGKLNREAGFLDYHMWQMIKTLAIMMLALASSAFSSYIVLGVSILGSWWIGFFIFERALNYVNYNRLFPQKSNWNILWWEIPRRPWQDFMILLIGIIVFYLSFII